MNMPRDGISDSSILKGIILQYPRIIIKSKNIIIVSITLPCDSTDDSFKISYIFKIENCITKYVVKLNLAVVFIFRVHNQTLYDSNCNSFKLTITITMLCNSFKEFFLFTNV